MEIPKGEIVIASGVVTYCKIGDPEFLLQAEGNGLATSGLVITRILRHQRPKGESTPEPAPSRAALKPILRPGSEKGNWRWQQPNKS
jgi:hypothetical protein